MTRSGTELKHEVQARNSCAVASPSLVERRDRCRRAAGARRDPFGRRQAVNEHHGEHFVILTDAAALEHGQAGKPAAARACAAVAGSDGTLVNAFCVGGAHDMSVVCDGGLDANVPCFVQRHPLTSGVVSRVPPAALRREQLCGFGRGGGLREHRGGRHSTRLL